MSRSYSQVTVFSRLPKTRGFLIGLAEYYTSASDAGSVIVSVYSHRRESITFMSQSYGPGTKNILEYLSVCVCDSMEPFWSFRNNPGDIPPLPRIRRPALFES